MSLKQQIVQGVCFFDVVRVSEPFLSINYDLTKKNAKIFLFGDMQE